MLESLESIKKLIGENRGVLEKKYKIRSIGVFGSYARKEACQTSDLDLLVDFTDPPDLIEFIRMENYLGRLLGRKIDLVSKNALKPLIREEILRETVYL
jgi:predicted nucleotidyltransferase